MRKILSIDGGGIEGVFPAAFLSTIEDRLPHNIGNYFDLIVGTSTGGIIALGLGAGLHAKEILAFYEEKGPVIFGGSRTLGGLRSLVTGRYNSESLRNTLNETFGNRLIGHSTTRLVIPSQNLETGEVHLFKTSHHLKFIMDYEIPMAEVALATSAAPSFLPTHKLPTGTPLVDGGTWANNPAGVAAVEAIGVPGWQAGEVLMLSLSCTKSPLDASLAISYSLGKAYWVAKLVDVLGAGQSSSSLGIAQVLLGHDKVYRIEPVVPVGRFALDKHKGIDALKGLGASEARKAWTQLTPFYAATAEPFVPCHTIEEFKKTT